MTPREGVEVVEAMLPTVEEIRDAHDADMLASYSEGLSLSTAKRLAAKKVRDLVVQHIAAHPAATAREEAIRAEVIEECARSAEEVARRLDANPDMGYSADLCARMIRALALARSTGGDVNA